MRVTSIPRHEAFTDRVARVGFTEVFFTFDFVFFLSFYVFFRSFASFSVDRAPRAGSPRVLFISAVPTKEEETSIGGGNPARLPTGLFHRKEADKTAQIPTAGNFSMEQIDASDARSSAMMRAYRAEPQLSRGPGR